MTRRDMCYLVGKRAGTLTAEQAAWAWLQLAIEVEGMGELDLPKFRHLLHSIRIVTICAKQGTGIPLGYPK